MKKPFIIISWLTIISAVLLVGVALSGALTADDPIIFTLPFKVKIKDAKIEVIGSICYSDRFPARVFATLVQKSAAQSTFTKLQTQDLKTYAAGCYDEVLYSLVIDDTMSGALLYIKGQNVYNIKGRAKRIYWHTDTFSLSTPSQL